MVTKYLGGVFRRRFSLPRPVTPENVFLEPTRSKMGASEHDRLTNFPGQVGLGEFLFWLGKKRPSLAMFN